MSLDAVSVYPDDATLHCAPHESAPPGSDISSCLCWKSVPCTYRIPLVWGSQQVFINTRSQQDELLVAECKTTCSPRFFSPLVEREGGSNTNENITNSGEQLKLAPFLLQMGSLLRDTELVCLFCHA